MRHHRSVMFVLMVLACIIMSARGGIAVAATNLIPNPSLEQQGANGQPASWAQGHYGINQPLFVYPVAGFNSTTGARVKILDYVSGDAKWYFREIAVIPGVYTFSDDYNCAIRSFITVQFRMKDGTFQYLDIARLLPTTDWQHISVPFTVPANVVSLTIFHLIKNIGALTVDNYALVLSSFNGMVSLNFDDGTRSTYENGLPILNKAGLKSTQYIITGRFNFPGYVNANEVLAMQAAGHEIGAHTRTHPDLTTLTVDQMRNEIAGSKADLLAIGVTSVETFAYPFGGYNDTVVQVVKDAGFLGARTTDGGYNTIDNNRFLLQRQGIRSFVTLDQIKSWIDTAAANNVWLILVFHRIEVSDDTYSIPPDMLQQIIDYIIQKQIPVVTNDQVIRTIM